MIKHGETERSLVRLFESKREFDFKNEKFRVVSVGKPTLGKGECKTDIYVLAKNISTGADKEFKISVKQNDADFLENKMSIGRAREIFGEQAKEVMVKSIRSIEKSFLDEPLVVFEKYKRTPEKSMKIGWKFELLNKAGGNRSGLLSLTDEQKIDVYSGSNLSPEKKNAKVNGSEIPDSGVANFILNVGDTTKGLNHYMKDLKPIEEFAVGQDIFFACKAINYRSTVDKWDGDRPLAVYVDWNLTDGKLSPKLVFDRPLEVKANEIGKKLRGILGELGIGADNFSELKKHMDENSKGQLLDKNKQNQEQHSNEQITPSIEGKLDTLLKHYPNATFTTDTENGIRLYADSTLQKELSNHKTSHKDQSAAIDSSVAFIKSNDLEQTNSIKTNTGIGY